MTGESHLAQVASGCAEGGAGAKREEGLRVRREPEQAMRAWSRRLLSGQFRQRGRRWGDSEAISDLEP